MRVTCYFCKKKVRRTRTNVRYIVCNGAVCRTPGCWQRV